MKWIVKILLLLLLSSCEKEYYYEYVVKNNTAYDVSIEGYNRIDISNQRIPDSKSTLEIIDIKPFSSYRILKARGFHPDPVGIFNSDEIDSVNIFFNKEKIIVQSCDEPDCRFSDIERNIMGYDSEYEKVKTGRSSGEKEYRFTYTITEDDYNRAVSVE